MHRALVLAVLLVLTPTAARAQDPGALFIAPWGEPVRGAEGEAPVAIWFRTSDADQSGALSLEEALARADRFFVAVDRNQDGRITAMESSALFRATAPEMYNVEPGQREAIRRLDPAGSMLRGPHEPRTRREEEAPRGAARFGLLADVIEPVMSCDADISRWVTRDEFAACVTRRFRQLDANGDGGFELSESPRAAELTAASSVE